MFTIRDLLRRRQSGQGMRSIAEATGLDRKTVRRYIEAAEARGFGASHALDDDFVRAVMGDVQDRAAPAPTAVREALDAKRVELEAWLSGTEPLRLTRVHELLARDGVEIGYTSLRRYAHDVLGWREPTPTVRVDDPPYGDEVQVDFGLMGRIADGHGGHQKLYVLLVTLTASRHLFVWPCFTQTTVDVIDGLEAAWRFFGGMPKRIVLDNASSMIVRAHDTDPVRNRAFAEYADARVLLVDPARVRAPQDKARVENQVAYVRERWFAGETFTPFIERTREHAARWCREVAGTRVHGTTRERPIETFETHERPLLQPAPTDIYDVPVWRLAKVHPDHHVQVAQALYSLPTKYIGSQVLTRADRRSVRISIGDDVIKVHPRVPAGKRSTDPADYPDSARDPAFRSIDRLLARARAKTGSIAQFAEQLLAGPHAWTRMRQGYGLLRLCDKYGDARVEAMCRRALEFDVVDVSRVERLLKDVRHAEDQAQAAAQLTPLPRGRFTREASQFATRRPGGDR
jgi:transposase